MAIKQYTSRDCFVCGRQNDVGLKLDFYTTSPGVCQARLKLSSHYEGYPGVVHGGIIAAILDETGGRSQMDSSNRFMVTAQLNVRYRKPVPVETPLTAIGTAIERRGRVSKAHAEIVDEDGTVLAEAELVLMDIPESLLDQADLEARGWKVYPEEDET